jgi:hypothetical protein
MSAVVVHWVGPDRMFGSRGLSVLQSRDAGQSWSVVCKLREGLGNLLASTRLSRRLLRAGVHHIQPLGETRLVIIANDFVQTFDTRRGEFLQRSPLHGSRPLTLCATPDECIYGEYRGNSERTPVHIYSSEDGVTWTARHRFDNVRHVHAVERDPYDGSLWATTGDEDRECGLWRCASGSKNWERVVGGTQQHRAVQLVFARSAIYFGTDAPGDSNRIYRLDRSTLQASPMATVRGPIFFGCKVGRRIFFATVCEPTDRSRNRTATVWGGDEETERFVPLLGFRKDRLPMRLFQYGQVKFPAGHNPGPLLWLTPFGTEMDQRSLAYDAEQLFGDAIPV